MTFVVIAVTVVKPSCARPARLWERLLLRPSTEVLLRPAQNSILRDKVVREAPRGSHANRLGGSTFGQERLQQVTQCGELKRLRQKGAGAFRDQHTGNAGI